MTTIGAKLIKIDENNKSMHFEINYEFDYSFPGNKYSEEKPLIITPEQVTAGKYKIEAIKNGGKKSRAKKYSQI